MNRVQYHQFVRQIETKFHGKPKQLEKVAMHYIALSYAYLMLVMLGALGLLVALVYWMVAWPSNISIQLGVGGGIVVLIFLLSLAQGLRVRTIPPEGVPISRQDSPELFRLLDDLKKEVANAKFDHVLVDGEFNAAVYQMPRLGLLGWYRNYLLLGLPLMQAMDVDEFKSVLAHEFSHLSNKDGASGNWIYRIRVAWEQIMGAIQEGGGTWALAPFLNWFWPRFNAHAFVLSRQHEYRADATSLEYAGQEAVASSLQKVEVYDRVIHQSSWNAICELANDQPEPPKNPYGSIRDSLIGTKGLPPESSDWLKQAFARPTDYSDTHPALKDRLIMLDVLPDEVSAGEPVPIPEVEIDASAAVLLFGSQQETKLMQQLSDEWLKQTAEPWKARYDEVKEIRKELGSEAEVTTAADAWKWASAMLNLSGSDAAMPWVDKVLNYEPEHVAARFVKGCSLLDRNDVSGVPILEAVVDDDPSYGYEALNMLKMHYSTSGDHQRYLDIDRRVDEYDDLVEVGQKERLQISKRDQFADHQLTGKLLESVQKELGEFKYINKCHAARKVCEHFPKVPCYIFIITPKTTSYINENTSGQIAEELAPLLEGYFSVFFWKDNKGITNLIAERDGSLVFDRKAED